MPVRCADRLKRPHGSTQRALYKSMGYRDEDLGRPIVGIANAYSTIVPGHYNLRSVGEAVRAGVTAAGGTAVEFGVPGICDGLADHHIGAHYTLPSRDVVAAAVEVMVQGHGLDGVVLLGSCDKIVPGMLMAAARLDAPAILLAGGPAEGGVEFDGRASDSSSPDDALPMLEAGELDEATFRLLENHCQPSYGSCAYLGTANSMCCAAEAMGMSLPGTATIPAPAPARLDAAELTGRRIVDLVRQGVRARSIISRAGLENAVRVMSAIGGSTNSVLHLLAIASEAEVELDMDDFDFLWRSTPHIARMNPAAPATVPDFHRAGGVPAVMHEILPLLHAGALTVSGSSVAQNVGDAEIADGGIIRPLGRPWNEQGGLAVLRGNLAPESAIARPAAIDPSMHVFSGSAMCFDSEAEAVEAILGGEVGPGTVLVVRYVGPRGGPGMPEMYAPLKYLYGKGLAMETAVVSDGRFSGTNNGCFVGHISPEAARGGPIAAVEDGDVITIDIPAGSLRLHVDADELQRRLRELPLFRPCVQRGYLALYARLAQSAHRGALLELAGDE